MVYIIAIVIVIFILLLVFAFVLQPKQYSYKGKYKKSSIDYIFYWINLDNSTVRKERMKNLFKKQKVKNVRISAIDGGTDSNLRACACCASHIKTIETFYESGDDVGIICEDDVSFEYKKYWRNSLTNVIHEAPKDWEILQLSATISWFWPYAIIKNSKQLYIPYNESIYSALCYVINRKGAEKLLKSNEKPSNLTEHYIYKKVKTYTYKYPMFTYPTENDSTIHSDHIPGHVLSKNLITKHLRYSK